MKSWRQFFIYFFQCGYFRVLAGVHDRRRCDSRRAQYYQETLRIAQTVGSTHGPLAATRRSVLPPRRHNPIVFEQQVCIWDLLLREKNTNTCFSFSIVCLVHLFCLLWFFSRSSLNRIVHKSLRDVVIVRSSTIYVNDFFYSKDDFFQFANLESALLKVNGNLYCLASPDNHGIKVLLSEARSKMRK